MYAVYRVLTVILAGIFLAACWDKILHPDQFAQIIRAYRLVPDVLVNPAAVWLPWLELTLGILLLLNRWASGALLLANLLFLVFLAALAVNAVRGIDVNCGCFVTTPEAGAESMAWYLTRDTGFLVLGLAAVWTGRRSQK
ncbi:MauE/DoxX family redox-associated membrane protein [Oceanidesulfovibrio marinus]|uniref:Methylamine utilization MauE n=1 Tax=Oceanidesulfovibrio marinus TaxID=370038 RepID=A0A6P1ZF58_9BACT|nr:MauE/DoxX family redox-associated membrane protein [Oceanidesulfovibrio marinus]QJT07823.1 methylamine utilization MauE [Oceanidesulfovibrio marinus]TVM33323.1 methylamine utilization MauE [Oceanidesulfovibrio marinus]